MNDPVWAISPLRRRRVNPVPEPDGLARLFTSDAMNMGDLCCSVCTSFDELEGLREKWDQLVLQSGAPVYMTYDWARLWWRFYGAKGELRVFIVAHGDTLVGLLPFYVSAVGIRPFQTRVGRLVGSNIPPKVFNPPVLPEFAREAWALCLDSLLIQDRCDLVSIGPLSETYRALEGLKSVTVGRSSNVAITEMVERGVHTVYYLPKTIEELFSTFESKERKTRRKKLRDLEAKGPLRVEITREPAAVASEFETFAQAHTAQWEAEGRPGHFHAWPRGLDYNRALVKTQGALDRVRFVRLLVGDQVVANQYNFSIGRRLYAELPARVFGPEWDRLSLGCSSQVKLLEAAIAEGYQIMESGLGHYEYKVLLGGREIPALVVRAHSSRAGTRARIRAGSTQRQLMLLFSQKLWYKRVSPLLPKSLRSGQSATAIAFDF